MNNEMSIRFVSLSQNEGFARVAVSAFAAQMNPNLEDIADIKTAVSEAVTNAIIHGYENRLGYVEIYCLIENDVLNITVRDEGKGIADVEEARAPFYTTKPEADRSGMGFTVMETFMDSVIVESSVGAGTTVFMRKRIEQLSEAKVV